MYKQIKFVGRAARLAVIVAVAAAVLPVSAFAVTDTASFDPSTTPQPIPAPGVTVAPDPGVIPDPGVLPDPGVIDPSPIVPPTADVTGGAPAAMDAPRRSLTTPWHAQERGYWCGPATVQIIQDYFGSPSSQAVIALRLGTTTNGTDFSRVDEVLAALTSKDYRYFGLLTESGFNSRVIDTIVNHGWPLAADVNIDASVWPYYAFDHTGHIIPLEAYSGFTDTIRINDPYDERDWRVGGGPTGGHTTYARSVIWSGVKGHFRRAVCAAP